MSDQDGIKRDCPHDPYGDRIPTHEDIVALTMLIPALEKAPIYDPAWEAVAQVITSYCRQFRDVAGPDKD